MKKTYSIKTISYYPVFVLMSALSLFILFFIIPRLHDYDKYILLITGFIFLMIWLILRWIFSGRINIEISNDKNKLIFRWTKRPFLSKKDDLIININDLKSIDSPINLSYSPNQIKIKTKSGKELKFFDPIFENNRELTAFMTDFNKLVLELNETGSYHE